MRQQLLAADPSSLAGGRLDASTPRRLGQNLGRLRGGSDAEFFSACGGCLFIVVLAFGVMFVSSLSPNEYGIMRNSITGSIDQEAFRGGIHITGPFKQFIKFPATQMTLMFSDHAGADRMPVKTRTGADHSPGSSLQDSDSGGQPISISCALQLEYIQELLPHVYLDFGSYEASKQRYILLASNMVSNTAQEFTPQNFWTERRKVTDVMLKQINHSLMTDGKVRATRFEILKVDFAMKFEDSITAVQVAEQQRVVNEYEQQVQTVVQGIEVLHAENNARIANILTGAEALARAQVANATRDGFNMKQSMKAKKYSELRDSLGFNQSQMAEYFKIKSVQGQESKTSKVIVGLPSVGNTGAPSARHQRAEL